MPRYVVSGDDLRHHPEGTLIQPHQYVSVVDSGGNVIDKPVFWYDTDTGEVCHLVVNGATAYLDDHDRPAARVYKYPAPLTITESPNREFHYDCQPLSNCPLELLEDESCPK